MSKYAIILILSTLLLTACSSGPPAIEVAESYDFGTVVKGDTVTATLPVRNAGRSDLVVEGVSTSCGCTTATLSATSLSPQEETTLRVSYDSGAHEADMGLVERYVFISTNDPERQDMMVKFTALVEDPAK